MSVYEKLLKVQSKLKAPKGQFNTFGNFNYRSCEDILEAVKPLLFADGCLLVISDEIVMVGTRIYVKATATFTDASTSESIKNVAFAREPESKTKMDEAQITGTSSSYARKYCLNGLFAIDDTKDADTEEYTKQNTEKPKSTAKPKQAKPVYVKVEKGVCCILTSKGMVNIDTLDNEKLQMVMKSEEYYLAKPHIEMLLKDREEQKIG